MSSVRSCLSILLLVLCSLQVLGQTAWGPEVSLGMSEIKFLPTELYINKKSHTTPVASARLGAMIDKPLHKHLYFQAGVLFTLKGSSRNFSYYLKDSFNEVVDQKLTLFYAEAPITMVFKSGEEGRGRVILGIGAVPAYLLSGSDHNHARGTYDGAPYDITGTSPVYADHPLKAFDLGLTLTAGYEWATGLYLRGYYTSGFNDLGPGTEIDKNRMWGICGGKLMSKQREQKKADEDLIDKSSE